MYGSHYVCHECDSTMHSANRIYKIDIYYQKLTTVLKKTGYYYQSSACMYISINSKTHHIKEKLIYIFELFVCYLFRNVIAEHKLECKQGTRKKVKVVMLARLNHKINFTFVLYPLKE